ncbi:pentatricopeptide (PPR) repeat-containing protein / CBS domain-containing protein [Wolffia australiana]
MRARASVAQASPLSRFNTRRRDVAASPKPKLQRPDLHLRRLTSRVSELTRRRQLDQVFEEVRAVKRRYGKLNTIVMNAVMEACVHCGNVDAAVELFDEMSRPDGCGVDKITFSTLLKGLGKAGRIDEAFQILESVERGNASGKPKLSSELIYGLLNALLESGDMRRANGLLARYRVLLREEGHSILLYNLLIKGYTNTDFPLGALAVRDEILRQGLKPDKLTYNTLILSCVKSGRMDVAMGLLSEMKEEAKKTNNADLFPDTITYTTLLQGFRCAKDLPSVMKTVMEMKSSPNLVHDRVAYTAIVDAFLGCDSTKDALCIFGEIIKLAGAKPSLRPKPHLFLSMMRKFAAEGDFKMVERLHRRILPDSSGFISAAAHREAEELLMEAAANSNRVDLAQQILSSIVRRGRWSSWASRGGMAALRVEALTGFADSSPIFRPQILSQISLDDPIEKHMIPFEEAKPLRSSSILRNVAMRFYRDSAVPVVDDWGSCVGIVHRADCCELDAPISAAMAGPPPLVDASTSTGRVVDLLLQKKCEMVVVVTGGGSKPAGIFTRLQILPPVPAAPRVHHTALFDSARFSPSDG